MVVSLCESILTDRNTPLEYSSWVSWVSAEVEWDIRLLNYHHSDWTFILWSMGCILAWTRAACTKSPTSWFIRVLNFSAVMLSPTPPASHQDGFLRFSTWRTQAAWILRQLLVDCRMKALRVAVHRRIHSFSANIRGGARLSPTFCFYSIVRYNSNSLVV